MFVVKATECTKRYDTVLVVFSVFLMHQRATAITLKTYLRCKKYKYD